eukprot:865990-Prymnesium_polylepis.1
MLPSVRSEPEAVSVVLRLRWPAAVGLGMRTTEWLLVTVTFALVASSWLITGGLRSAFESSPTARAPTNQRRGSVAIVPELVKSSQSPRRDPRPAHHLAALRAAGIAACADEVRLFMESISTPDSNRSACSAPEPVQLCQRCTCGTAGRLSGTIDFDALMRKLDSCQRGGLEEWQWDSSVDENLRSIGVHGLEQVAGMASLLRGAATIVRSWPQTHIPALVGSGERVRGAPGWTARLCQLWHNTQNYLPSDNPPRELPVLSYLSWPLLLGCDGWQWREAEAATASVASVVALPCASASFATVMEGGGVTVFDADRWYMLDQSVKPPSLCG